MVGSLLVLDAGCVVELMLRAQRLTDHDVDAVVCAVRWSRFDRLSIGRSRIGGVPTANHPTISAIVGSCGGFC
jgi:hypothetical protein